MELVFKSDLLEHGIAHVGADLEARPAKHPLLVNIRHFGAHGALLLGSSHEVKSVHQGSTGRYALVLIEIVLVDHAYDLLEILWFILSDFSRSNI